MCNLRRIKGAQIHIAGRKNNAGYKIETWFFPAQDMPDYKAGHGGNQSPMVVDFERWMNEILDFMEG